MRNKANIFVGISLALISALSLHGATFTTAVQQPGGQHWNQTIWQPGAVAPSAGNTYICVAGGNPTRIRNPTTAPIQTFIGDSLQLNTGSEIRAKVPNAQAPPTTINFPGVGGNAGLIMNGGNLDTGDNGFVFSVTGVMLVQANSSFTCGDSAANDTRGWIVGAQIRGSGNLTITKNFATGPAAVDITSADNPFTGNWIVNGGYFKATGSNSLGSSFGSGNITINPGVGGAVFEPMYDVTNYAGTLTLAPGNTVMRMHQNCRFDSLVIDGAPIGDGEYDSVLLFILYPSHFPDQGSGIMYIMPPPPPSTPATLTAINGDGQVTLQWPAATLASGYNVYRSLTSGSGYSVVGGTASTSFQDMGLVNGTTYYYVVTSTNRGGESANSPEAIGRPSSAVTGLTATGGTGQVALAWNAFVGATSYNVKRSSVSGGPYTTIASGRVPTDYLDTSAALGQTSYYIVTANLALGESAPSAEASATTAPARPVVTVEIFSVTGLKIGWSGAGGVVTQYSLESSADGVNFAPLTTTAGNVSSYIHSGLAPSTPYYYRVQAQNDTGFSPISAVASNTTPPVSGIDVNFANGSAPIPPGYVVDIGDTFADRGNGYLYGWDRNIVADGRYRQAANSPDIRYDTFMHLIKAVPPAIWEIEIPNGLYWVHIVGGDPANVDSVFQFDIEGVITPTVTPGGPGSVFNNWCDFAKTTVVSDGRLTIRSGPNSQTTGNNNKIGFINIYPGVAVPVGISQQPQSQTVDQNAPVALTVAVTNAPPPPNTQFYGADPITYQWYHVGSPDQLVGTSATLNIASAQPGDGGGYYAVVTNPAGVVTSVVATVTVRVPCGRPTLTDIGYSGGAFHFQFASASGCSYVIEFKNNLEDPTWSQLGTALSGTGGPLAVSDPDPQDHRFYRVRLGP